MKENKVYFPFIFLIFFFLNLQQSNFCQGWQIYFYQIKIISVRIVYDNQFTNNNKLRKLAFLEVQIIYKNNVTNIISFEDSIIYNDAVKFGSFLKNVLLKILLKRRN